jgi:hypothetical protein
MSTSRTPRGLLLETASKISIPLLLGLIAIVSSDISGLSALRALGIGAVVFLGFLLVFFLIDVTSRFDSVHEHLSAGFAKIDRSATAHAGPGVRPLLQRLARREIERVTEFVQQLPVGNVINYEGEDREWLLGLTAESQVSIDAISLSTVDAGLVGFDGGLWTSDLGSRYLELQREAIGRHVAIRRIFVFEKADLVRDEIFLTIIQAQRDLGIDVRMLDQKLIPEWLRPMIFDFIIFDRAVSYEMTPATSFNVRPAFVRTVLAPKQDRIDDLQGKFEELWLAADPKREIRERARNQA